MTLAYVCACGGDPLEWERIWQETAADMDVPRQPAVEPGQRAPYAGLAAFRTQDAEWFFGRERLVAQVLRRLREQRFVVVIGASGSGKSSLLRAGLVPALRQRTVVFTPGPRPVEECAIHIAAIAGGTPGRWYEELRADPANLHRALRQALAAEPPENDIVLVVDQFEETFTQGTAEDAAFISALVTAARAPNSRCRVVLAVRADFYAHCVRHPDLARALHDAQVPVGPMSLDELRSAIVQPAVRSGLTVEGALLATLTAQAHGRPGVLPLLSHALLETWRRRRGNALTLDGFRATGGLEGALARTAETFYEGLTTAQRDVARQVFTRLTALGEGTEDTRRRMTRAELDDTPDVRVVLERAAAARLLLLDQDRIELTHEALIRCWPRLHQWLTRDREALRIQRRLTEAADLWESLDRDAGALYRGAALSMARNAPLCPSRRERAFLQASVEAAAVEAARGQRRSRRMRQLAALLAVLLVAAVGAVGVAVRAQQQLTRQRDMALAQESSAQAVALRAARPALAAQLSLAALRLVPGAAQQDALMSTMAVALPNGGGQQGHTQAISSVAFGPNGRWVATGSFDHTVRLWNITDPLRPVPGPGVMHSPDVATGVAFSPDGRLVATAGRDRTVRLWDVGDRRRPVLVRTLTGHRDIVFSVAFSPDGRLLASGSYDHTVRLWNVTEPSRARLLSALTGHRLNVKPVAFSPDGRLLASGSDDRTVRLWDVTDGRRPRPLGVLTGHRDFVDAVAISPDGRTLASGSDDRTIRLWNITDPRHPVSLKTLTGHADVVTSVAFSPDGRLLLSGSNDRTSRLWDVTDPRTPRARHVLTGHLGAVNAVAFSPDERLLLTGSADHTAQLWRPDVADAAALACSSRAHPTITEKQWRTYLPGVAYQPPCEHG
ncbi:WD40 repeat domain-containing protein [Streptomyces misionensis]|uniref:WD40 repeat domain-containing protein n=1 Tax=Streptomyces misionensis TaxID=67331 RepID=UPI001C96BA0C|nr:WD40 repeat domain-containing protein [Streptomyces misionensis]